MLVLRRISRACWNGFFVDGKTWPGFLFPVLVAIARGESTRKRCFSRYVIFAARVQYCPCWGRFHLNGEICRGFTSSVLVGVDNLGSITYSTTWLYFPGQPAREDVTAIFLAVQWLQAGFPVDVFQVGERRQCRVNLGQSFIPADSRELVLVLGWALLLALALSCASALSRTSDGMPKLRCRTATPRWMLCQSGSLNM